MCAPSESESCSQCRALEQQLSRSTAALAQQLSRSTAALAEARVATDAARAVVSVAQELNVELLAERERRVTVPELEQLRRRSQLLDEMQATRTFRWSRAPRSVYGAARRFGRRVAE